MYPPVYSDTGVIITTTTNLYGERVAGSDKGTTVPVRFSESSSYARQQFMESIDADSMCYTPPTSPFAEGSIFKYNGQYYRTVKIITARTGKYNAVQFLQVYFKRDRGLIS